MDHQALQDLIGGLTAALASAHSLEDAIGKSQCAHISSLSVEMERALLAYSAICDDHDAADHGMTVQPALPTIIVMELGKRRG